jgi:hypothetical protein
MKRPELHRAIERLFAIYEEAVKPPVLLTDADDGHGTTDDRIEKCRDGKDTPVVEPADYSNQEIRELIAEIRRVWESEFRTEIPEKLWRSGLEVRMSFEFPNAVQAERLKEEIRDLRDKLLVKSEEPPGVIRLEFSDETLLQVTRTDVVTRPETNLSYEVFVFVRVVYGEGRPTKASLTDLYATQKNPRNTVEKHKDNANLRLSKLGIKISQLGKCYLLEELS